MAMPILTDELWAAIEPLLPVHVPSPNCGHPRVSDRAALTGILYVLHTGIPWEYLPNEMGCGCGMTCWRRLRDWRKAGVWQRLHESVLHNLRQFDQIEWELASIDSASVPSPPSAGITPAPIPQCGASSVANTTSSSINGAASGSQAFGGQCP
jgi:transposase